MLVKKSVFLLMMLLLAACSLSPVRSLVPGYVTNERGQLLATKEGNCWRTAAWRPALAIPECDPLVVQQVEEEKVAKQQQKEEEELAKVEEKKEKAKKAADANALDLLDGFEEKAKANAAATGKGALIAENKPPIITTAPNAKPVVVKDEIIYAPLFLNGDASFRFGDDHLTQEAKDAVLELAGTLKARRAADMKITIIGHSDRVGSAKENLDLSRRRAAAVRNEFVQNGIEAKSIEVLGMGSAKPITDPSACPSTLVKCELIDCLRPDRRVEIKVKAKVQMGTKPVGLSWPPFKVHKKEAMICRA